MTGNHSLLSFEQAVTATLVTDVQIAPDGRRVAYVTTEASKSEEHPRSTIWLVDAEEGLPRRLTTSEAADGFPRWSPDSRHIAFVSDRVKRGSAQIYLIGLSSGEAVRLTDHDGSVTALEWSPDGAQIAYTAIPGETEEERQRREERDDAKVVDENVKRAGLWLIDPPGNPATMPQDERPEPRRISPEDLHIGTISGQGFTWTPDGRGFVVVISPAPKAHYTFEPELATMDLNGAVTRLGKFEGLLSKPAISPDGATIAFIGAEDRSPAWFALRTIPTAGGESKVALPGYEASFFSVVWLDSHRVVTVTQRGQRQDVQVVDLESGAVTDLFDPLGAPGSTALVSATPDGCRAAFLRADATSYGDVYVADAGGETRKLTDLNPWLREHDLGVMREVSWTSFDGLEIQGLLILPVGYEEGQRYPTLLHIHGGPSSAWTWEPYAGWHDWGQFMAQRGYAVLMPNPRGSSGRGSEFLCHIVGCYGEPDWQDLMAGVDHLIEQGIADADRLVVGGWSGGGFLTNWTITHTDRFKAAISGAGISNWVSFQGTTDVRSVFDAYLGPVADDPDAHWRLSPIRYINQAKTPTLILYGEADERVPVSQGYELYEGLKSVGAETQMVAYPREPHGIQERKHQIDLLQRVVDWYDRHLNKG